MLTLCLIPSTTCIVSLFEVWAECMPQPLYFTGVCACVRNHVSKTCLCVFKCVSLTSCTGQRKWGGTQSGPHLSVSLRREEPRALNARNAGTHTHTLHTLYKQIDYACSNQLRRLDLLMYAPRQFYVCERFMWERKDGEREGVTGQWYAFEVALWERRWGGIKRMTHII